MGVMEVDSENEIGQKNATGKKDQRSGLGRKSAYVARHRMLRTDFHARTPMGEYIVRPGDRALTKLVIPTPGPADYSVTNYTLRRAPKCAMHKQFLMPGRPIDDSPGPIYEIENQKKCNLGITLKPKLPPKPLEETLGHYNISHYLATGSDTKKVSVRPKPKSDRPTGLISDQMLKTTIPTDMGPSATTYNPQSPDRSIPIILKSRIKPLERWKCPDPTSYTITNKTKGPKFSFGIKPPSEIEKAAEFPAPNSYVIKSTFGSGPRVVMKKRPDRIPITIATPGPLDYCHEPGPRGPSWSMSFQPLGTGAEVVHPAPNTYTLPDTFCGKKGALFAKKSGIMLAPQEFSFDRSLDESIDKLPVSYLPVTPFTKNNGPFFSIRSRPKDIAYNANQPAPNTYYPSCDTVKPATPKYSLGARFVTKPKKAVEDYKYYEPYNPPNGPFFTFCAPVDAYKVEEEEDKPAPNTYYPKISHRGPNKQLLPTFKGRHSPYVYKGFKRVQTMQQVDRKTGNVLMAN